MSQSKHLKKKVCQYCGKEYLHWNGRSKYCEGPHYATCVVCGKKFEFDISKGRIPNCCCKECTKELRRRTSVEKYGTDVPSKSIKVKDKLSDSCKKAQEDVRKRNLEKYGVENTSQLPEVRKRISDTLKSEQSQKKFKSTMRSRYGVDYAMQSEELFKKHAKASKSAVALDGTKFDSVEEKDVYEFLVRNNVNFQTQVPITYTASDGTSHVTYVDFCIDGILFEVKGGHLLDGVFDYKGVPIADKLNVYRRHHVVVVTDEGHRSLFGKPNSKESNGLKYLNKCPYPLIGVDVSLFTNPAFPYKEDRPPEFYDVEVSGQKSSYEAFFDEQIRLRMILNRVQYSGGFVDGNQILTALNVTRTCKQPSWFSKAFAKRIIENFVTSDVVVDPFAGWGTRYEACVELGKLYVGCDLNKKLVDWHRSRGRDIKYCDAKKFKYNAPCSVFVCPPYQDKEVYGSFQDSSLTQCQWLQVVMNNVPNASEYVMVCKVVDSGWQKYVVDEKVNKSHFGVNKEYVLVVPGKDSRNYTITKDDLKHMQEQADRLNEYRKLVSASKKKKDRWVWMSNKSTGECRCVPSDTEKQFEQYGWVRGRLSFSENMSDRVWVTDGKSNLRVHKKEVNQYLEAGWKLGRSYKGTLGYKWVNNGTDSKYVSSDEAERLVSEGWACGIVRRRKGCSTAGIKNKGRVHVHNPETGQSRMVSQEEARTLVLEGWKLGRGSFSMSNRTWIHNDMLQQNKRVKFDNVSAYEQRGWVRGRGRYNKK